MIPAPGLGGSPAPAVLCAGVVTVDLVQVVERHPGRNEKVTGSGHRIEIGGPAANAARTAAALGCSVRLVAPYGECLFTGFVRAELGRDGIEWIDPVAGQANPAPFSTVLVHAGSGDRSVVAGVGRAWDLGPDSDAARVAGTWVADVHAVLIDGYGGGLPALVAAAGARRGLPVLLDGGSHKPGMTDYLPDVSIALLSADFAAPEGGDPMSWVLDLGSHTAARSAGPDALVLRTGSGDTEIPVPGVDVVDTLGAGDVLHGAALAALAVTGAEETRLADVLRFATSVASESVRFPGALAWASDSTTLRRLRDELARLSRGDPPASA